MDRRNFTRLCSSLIAGASSLSLAQQSNPVGANTTKTVAKAADTASDPAQPPPEADAEAEADQNTTSASVNALPQSTLVFPDGKPITPDALAIGSAYIFHYPYRTTPCFLLRLAADKSLATTSESGDNSNISETAESVETVELTDKHGNSYQWRGGIGPDASIVAFSAICTHKMSHPAKPISHLNFRPENKVYLDRDGDRQQAAQLIYCCSEHSVYDPAKGAQVLSGPATQPLAAINLALSTNNSILATGIYGGNMLQGFLEKFGFRQAMEQKIADPYTAAAAQSVAVPAEEYSELRILC